jgi:RNA polymerase sigma-70 factor (ECF subfamily)
VSAEVRGISDAELVARARGGDPVAKAQLYERHVRDVTRLARKLCRGRGDVRDLVHDCFVVAFGKLTELEKPEALRYWLAGTLLRVHRRTVRREMRLSSQRCTSFLNHVSEARRGVTWSAEDVIELRRVAVILDGMPEKQRAALLLHRVHGLTVEQVAGSVSASRSTVKRWLQRGHRALVRAAADRAA